MRNIDLAKNCSKITLRVMMRGRGKYVWRVGGVGTVIELQYHLPYKKVLKKKKKKSQKVAIYAFCSEIGRKHKQLKEMKIVALWAAGNRVGGIRGLLFSFVCFVWFDLYNCVGVLFFMESIDHV